MKGMITDIQRFSLKDGPGIRTTVFMKGCNLKCKWCHNPETFSIHPQRMVYPDHCIGCGACKNVCPTLRPEDSIFENPNCTNCGLCVGQCYAGALQMSGREMTTQQVMEEIVQDVPYYTQSGGGVTFSGGECTLQFDFLKDMICACRDMNISTAIESNMLLPPDKLSELLPLLNLVMLDVKILDSTKHCEWTGASNEAILKNVRLVAESGIPYIVRTPLIPGVTDCEEEIAQIARFLSGLARPCEYYELLRFNPLGAGKYSALRMPGQFADAKPTDPDLSQRLRAAAAQYGIPVRVN